MRNPLADVRLDASEHGMGHPMDAQLPFDRPSALKFAQSKADFLDWFVAHWGGPSFGTVLDVGTGIGFFAGHLAAKHDLQVTAIDVRLSNITEARRRYPQVTFLPGNVEDSSIRSLGTFDVVNAFGLLYHLENPFRAICNLADITRHALVLESLISPGREMRAWLLDESSGDDQGLHYIAWHLTEPAITKLLYRAGLAYVYRPIYEVTYPEFSASAFRRRTRTLLIASRLPLDSQHFHQLPEPHRPIDRAYYTPFWMRGIARYLLQARQWYRK